MWKTGVISQCPLSKTLMIKRFSYFKKLISFGLDSDIPESRDNAVPRLARSNQLQESPEAWGLMRSQATTDTPPPTPPYPADNIS